MKDLSTALLFPLVLSFLLTCIEGSLKDQTITRAWNLIQITQHGEIFIILIKIKNHERNKIQNVVH